MDAAQFFEVMALVFLCAGVLLMLSVFVGLFIAAGMGRK
jgi:hypothetical protein